MSLKVARMSSSDMRLPGIRELTRHISREEYENAQPLINLSQSAPHANHRRDRSREESDVDHRAESGRRSPSDDAMKGVRHDQVPHQSPLPNDDASESTTPSVETVDSSVVGQICR